jgi:hypothetical protein
MVCFSSRNTGYGISGAQTTQRNDSAMSDELDNMDIITVRELRDFLSTMPPNYKIVLASPLGEDEFFAISRQISIKSARPSHYTKRDIGENTLRRVIALYLTDSDLIRADMHDGE